MPWIDYEIDGKLTPVHMNFGSKRNASFKHCVFCLRAGRRSIGSFLCDFIERAGLDFTTNGNAVLAAQTCDKAMCEKCATSVGPNLHHCPNHKTQGALFESSASPESSDSFESDVAAMSAAALVAAGKTMSNWKYKTDGELRAAGYAFKNVARCSGATCGAQIEWWSTPQGKTMPLDEGSLQPHWSTCPDAKSYRSQRTSSASSVSAPVTAADRPSCTVCGSIAWENFCCPKPSPFGCAMPGCESKTPQRRSADVHQPMCDAHWALVPRGLQIAILKHAPKLGKLYKAALEAAVKEISE